MDGQTELSEPNRISKNDDFVKQALTNSHKLCILLAYLSVLLWLLEDYNVF